MGLDFGDLLNILPEGAAAQAAGQGANNIIDSYTKRQMDLENMNQAIVKNDMDRKIQVMTLPTKIMTENLLNAQKINLTDPDPEEEDFDSAFEELYPGKDPKTLNLDKTQIAQVHDRAAIKAKERLPKIDPWDTSDWMRARGPHAISDVQAKLLQEREEAQAAFRRKELEVKAKAWQAYMDRKTRVEEKAKDRTLTESEGKKGRGSREGIAARVQHGQNTRQDDSQAQRDYDNLRKQHPNGVRGMTDASLRKTVGVLESIRATGNQQAIQQAEQAFGEARGIVQRLDNAAKGKPAKKGSRNPQGYTQYENPRATYTPQGVKKITADGIVWMADGQGNWLPVK